MSDFSEEELDKIVKELETMGSYAFYLVGREYFGQVICYQPILAKPSNDAQEKAFQELLNIGFVTLETERGEVGYRSTLRGRYGNAIIKNSRK